jgi:hypothetical protein
MDRRAWKIQIEEEVIDDISRLLGVDEDDRASRRKGEQKIVERTILLVLVDPDNLARQLELDGLCNTSQSNAGA